TISFVRLGNCKLSKSKILNEVFSNRQQQQNFFMHRNMQSGDIPRTISNGLVEICWYHPCGNTNLDVFPEPLAIINLRGDSSSYLTQFEFLKTISIAVFIFVDSIDKNQFKLMSSIENSNQQETLGYVKKLATCLKLDGKHFIAKTGQISKADFVQRIQGTIKDILASSSSGISVEEMAVEAKELEINVDECDGHCLNAKKIAKDITSKIQDVAEYKERVFPLQGDLLKELAHLEKETHRLKKQGTENAELKTEILKKREKQNQYRPPLSTKSFINAIQDVPSEQRHYFLKWMKLYLDMKTRHTLSDLREEYKRCGQNSSGDCKKYVQLDQKIVKSSLGLEHFMREIGQIYEVESFLVDERKLNKNQKQYDSLPNVAAELILEGYPIELIDGDVSHVPIRWVTEVLIALKFKMRNNSRIQVITVLGVQSTGKSTLLNTMFGLQFAVSSGRCTRGAFMLLIKVKEDLREKLGCDFLLVIDTEGLKSPELSKLEGSYEHDNELATLVVGLSNITLVNMSMENSTEMKDILQIAVHAFLRMKKIGKKPNCQFLHQNVADAHDQNIRDRNLFLEELDKMTKAAAKMEKQSTRSRFSDVMEYNAEKDNSYISGLWNGVPPMAPVNIGYSENVYELKKDVIETLKQKKHKSMDILDFVKWIQSLWNAVKYENFVFNFRNSLVADAYHQLCSKYSSWESSFRRNIHIWLLEAETKILNHSFDELPTLSNNLATKVQNKLQSEENSLLTQLKSYFDSKVENVHLVEKYRGGFIRSASLLKTELQQHAFNKIRDAMSIRKGTENYDKIQAQYTKKIEKEVMHLLEECRKSRSQLDSQQLKENFEKMWRETLLELSFSKIQTHVIKDKVIMQLKQNLQNKRLAGVVNLDCCGKNSFNVKEDYVEIQQNKKNWKRNISEGLESQTDSLIQACNKFIIEKANTPNLDYDDTYTRELLQKIDEKLKQLEFQNLCTTPLYECDLKLHICGLAAWAFQRMHDKFIQDHDPLQRLEKKKIFTFQHFLHCWTMFTNILGWKSMKTFTIVKITSTTTVKYFQFILLKELLEEGMFKNYLQYIRNYEKYVKDWIFKKLVNHYTKKVKLMDVEKNCLSKIMQKVKPAVQSAKELTGTGDVSKFFYTFFDILKKDIVPPKESLGMILFQHQENIGQFAGDILYYIAEMEKDLLSQFEKNKLLNLPIKPQDELFKKVFGCGKQCPFCKVPCEAGGAGHTEYWAEIHRSGGLGLSRYEISQQLLTEICSTSVNSEAQFKNTDTKYNYYPYKDYRDYYPDWKIAGDSSIQASDYWKYVFAKYNENFAKAYNALKADIPEDWNNITQEKALESLKTTFNM
uniref:VLIG-type G domain-containing protein n=1 Tax=Latimeria chalumnae TaxID=7897 RepID=H3A1W4_LATCH